jgi:hypothetical protein
VALAVLLPTSTVAQSDKEAAMSCISTAHEQHEAAKTARIQSGITEGSSIRRLLQIRREQEHFCLQIADCVSGAAGAHKDLLREISFSTCIKDEMLDQYSLEVQSR